MFERYTQKTTNETIQNSKSVDFFIKLIKSELILASILSIATYLIFFYQLLWPNVFLGGNDPFKLFYPPRYYLYESLTAGKFPFWTERVFSGFPLYADSEKAYLHPLNILAILLFGPFTSYKILHFGAYLAGSLGLYWLLKKHGSTIWGFFVGNLVYYFSFFHLFHLQHFSFVLCTYLIPLGLYAVSQYKSFKWIIVYVLISLSNIYFGSFQAVVIFYMTTLLYWLAFEGCPALKSLVFTLVTTVMLSLPQVLPTAQLFFYSERGAQELKFTEGSFSPLMLINLIYPYSFGYGKDYKWNMVSKDYLIHETYVYVGVVALILAVYGFLSLSDTKLRIYLCACLGLFLILGFVEFIPLVSQFSWPIVSLFRYWGRSVVLAVLAISILASLATSRLTDGVRINFKFCLLAIPAIILVIIGLSSPSAALILKLATQGAFDFSWIWPILTVVAFFMLIFAYATKKSFFKLLLCSLVFFDLLFFGRRIVNDYLRDISNLYPKEQLAEYSAYKNMRLAIADPLASGNLGLYYQNWGILGYSQYALNSYVNYSRDLGLTSVKALSAVDFGKFGVAKAFLLDKTYNSSVLPTSLIHDFDGYVANYLTTEGHMVFNIYSNSPQVLQTYIINYPGWQLKINDTVADFTGDPYIKTMVPVGVVSLEFTFIPIIFFVGVILGLIYIVALAAFWPGLQKRLLL